MILPSCLRIKCIKTRPHPTIDGLRQRERRLAHDYQPSVLRH